MLYHAQIISWYIMVYLDVFGNHLRHNPILPVMPHKAVAEVQTIERRVWVLLVTDGRGNPLMDSKVVGVACFLWN